MAARQFRFRIMILRFRTLALILLSSTAMALTACREQAPQVPQEPAAQPAATLGDTVQGLGMDVSAIAQDKDGQLWFACDGDALYRHDGTNTLRYAEQHGLSSKFIRNIQLDVNGHLWVHTRERFFKFDGKTFMDQTDAITKAPFGPFTYSPGGLFFPHTEDICFYDGRSFRNFAIHPAGYTPRSSSTYREYAVYCTFVDRSGRAWFGTQEKGVCYYDGTRFIFLDQLDLGGPAVRAIFQDRNGVMWFGNNGGGLYRYDGNTLRNITEEKKLGNHDFLRGKMNVNKEGSLARVFALNEDEVGNLWIGTVDAGVWKYDGTTLTNYTVKDGLEGNSVSLIFKDNRGKLWFSSGQGMLRHFDGQRFVRTAVRQPLPF